MADVTYKEKYKKCNKARCLVCQTGKGHGPYWFSYQKVGTRVVETYYGRFPPPFIQQSGRTHRARLTGREQEWERLHAVLLEVEARHSRKTQQMPTVHVTHPSAQCIFLRGDVGVGKTRLAEEMAQEAIQQSWNVVFTHMYPDERHLPYRVWIAVLRALLVPGSWQHAAVIASPDVYSPLSLFLPELTFSSPLSMSASEQEHQLRLWEAVRALLVLLADQTPLLVLFDDVHWVDEQSAHLLMYLARHTSGSAVVFVGTCRDNELVATHPLYSFFGEQKTCISLSIGPLAPEHIGHLITQVASSLTETQQRTVQDRAAGNPFFAEELAHTFALHRNNDVLATSITSVLDQRIQQLSPACQNLLSAASVLGGVFEYTVLHTIFSPQTPDEETILRLLEEACQMGVITEENTPTHLSYVFWHPLLVQHLYERLSAVRRARFHRRAAVVFEGLYRGHDAEGAALITHHLALGNAESTEIVLYAERAGDAAYTLSAYVDAEKYYTIALAHLAQQEKEAMAILQEKLGECARIMGSYEEARLHYQRALSQRSRHSSRSRHERQREALLSCEIGLTWYDVGAIEQAQECYREAERLLRAASIEGGAAWANIRFRQSYAHWQLGHIDEAQVAASESFRLFQDSLSRPHQKHALKRTMTRIERSLLGDNVDIGRVHVLLGSLASVRGELDTALAHLQEALHIYNEYDCRREIALVCCTLGDAYLRRAEYDLARTVLTRSQALAERSGDVPLLAVICGNFGILARRVGMLADAERWFTLALLHAETTQDPVYISIVCSYSALTLHESGRGTYARSVLARALRLGRVLQTTQCLGFALVVRCSLYVSQAVRGDKQEKKRLTRRVRHLLGRVLLLPGIEVETQGEALLQLARIAQANGETLDERVHASQALHLAQQQQLVWLETYIQQEFGSIL